MVTFEGFDANLQSFPSKIQQKEVMNRKKRKRVEDTTDVASYMLHHNIFSYYGMQLMIVLYMMFLTQKKYSDLVSIPPLRK